MCTSQKGDDALRLASKGRCGSVKLCDPIVTHGPYLSALEIKDYQALYKLICLLFFTFKFPQDSPAGNDIAENERIRLDEAINTRESRSAVGASVPAG